MAEGKNNRALSRLKQAQESMSEAKTLLIQDAEVNFVMNSLYYAFLYPVLGLLEVRGITSSTQSIAITLFEHEYVQTGSIDGRFLEALRNAFDLRPSCACEGHRIATVEDVERLLPMAEAFLDSVKRFIE